MDRIPPDLTRNAADPVLDVQQQFARLEAQLELLKAQVRQAQQLSSLGTAAAMIAHEVNNLLTPILAYTQAALSANDTDLMKRALSVTVRQVQILIAMSDRVLKISAAKATAAQVVPIRPVVEEAVASLCRDLARDGITLSIEMDEGLSAWFDPLQLQQILFNLFLNAREAMARSHSGRLTVTAQRQDDRIVIQIRNTGEPIPADLLPQVFDPFRSSKPIIGGATVRCSGLGLTLCRDLVEENGGSISVTSDLEAGTVFTITVPAEGPSGAAQG